MEKKGEGVTVVKTEKTKKEKEFARTRLYWFAGVATTFVVYLCEWSSSFLEVILQSGRRGGRKGSRVDSDRRLSFSILFACSRSWFDPNRLLRRR